MEQTLFETKRCTIATQRCTLHAAQTKSEWIVKTETVVVFVSSGEAIPGRGGQQPAAHQRPAPGAEEQPALWGAARDCRVAVLRLRGT